MVQARMFQKPLATKVKRPKEGGSERRVRNKVVRVHSSSNTRIVQFNLNNIGIQSKIQGPFEKPAMKRNISFPLIGSIPTLKEPERIFKESNT